MQDNIFLIIIKILLIFLLSVYFPKLVGRDLKLFTDWNISETTPNVCDRFVFDNLRQIYDKTDRLVLLWDIWWIFRHTMKLKINLILSNQMLTVYMVLVRRCKRDILPVAPDSYLTTTHHLKRDPDETEMAAEPPKACPMIDPYSR